MKYLFCYDITNPKRLAEVSGILEERGHRIQYSFFCCDSTKEEVYQLFLNLKSKINNKTDKLAVFPVCEKCFNNILNFGKDEMVQFPTFLVI